jgi:hypothetical protein
VIAVAVPAIPIITIGSRRNLVLRRIGIATDGRHFSAAHFRAALRGRNLGLSLAHNHERVAIGLNFNAKNTIVMRRMDRDIRRVNLGLGLTVSRDCVVDQALRKLNLDIFLRQVGDVDRRVRTEADSVGEIEL